MVYCSTYILSDDKFVQKHKKDLFVSYTNEKQDDATKLKRDHKMKYPVNENDTHTSNGVVCETIRRGITFHLVCVCVC